MRTHRIAAIALGLTLACFSSVQAQQGWQGYRGRTIPAGTDIAVRLDSKISTDDSRAGDQWVGTVTRDVYSNGRVMIPAGSQVSGVVTSSVQGTHNSRPSLDLAMRRVEVNGYSRSISASTPTIVAGSKRAKKIGAIALGTAGGALVGGAVGGKKGAIIGGLLGGGATYGATRHAFRTMQLKPGTELTFTLNESVAMRRY
jgi:hypothetical protein